MEAIIPREMEPSASDLEVTTRRGEAEAKGNGQKLREKLQAVVEKSKEVCERLQNQTKAAAKATDQKVREHPYQAMGIVFGLGVIIGALVMRSRKH